MHPAFAARALPYNSAASETGMPLVALVVLVAGSALLVLRRRVSVAAAQQPLMADDSSDDGQVTELVSHRASAEML